MAKKVNKGTKIDEVIDKPKEKPEEKPKTEVKPITNIVKETEKIIKEKPKRTNKGASIAAKKRWQKIKKLEKLEEKPKEKTIVLNPELKKEPEKPNWKFKAGIYAGIALAFAGVAFIMYRALDERRKQKQLKENGKEEKNQD